MGEASEKTNGTGKFSLKCLIAVIAICAVVAGTAVGSAFLAKDAVEKKILNDMSAYISSDGVLFLVLSDDTKIRVGKVTGEDGKDGEDGLTGMCGYPGADGMSAFELFNRNNPDYEGTEEEWLESLKGRGIASLSINGKGELVVVYTDGTEENLGSIR